MTQSQNLARNQQVQGQELAQQRKEITLQDVCDMTGYDLPQVAMIRHNMALSLSVTPDKVPLYDLALFCHASRTLDLDPLLRQAYWISRKGKGTLQVGIDGYRAIAERTGVYAGSEPPTFRGYIDQEYSEKVWQQGVEKWQAASMTVPEKAQVVVWKIVAGHKCAFTGEARWVEFYPGQGEGFQWRKMPHHMLAKVAEGQALRKAFPAQLGSVEMAAQDPVEGELPEVAAPKQTVIEEQPRRSKVGAVDYDRIYKTAYPDEAPQPEPEPEESPIGYAMSHNSKLLDDAGKFHIPGLGKYKADESWPIERIEAANAALGDRIKERNGDAETAAKQDVALG